MEKFEFDTFFGVIGENNVSDTFSIRKMGNHGKVELVTNDKHELFYECKITDELIMNMSKEELDDLIKECGWVISKDKTKLVRNINI